MKSVVYLVIITGLIFFTTIIAGRNDRTVDSKEEFGNKNSVSRSPSESRSRNRGPSSRTRSNERRLGPTSSRDQTTSSPFLTVSRVEDGQLYPYNENNINEATTVPPSDERKRGKNRKPKGEKRKCGRKGSHGNRRCDNIPVTFNPDDFNKNEQNFIEINHGVTPTPELKEIKTETAETELPNQSTQTYNVPHDFEHSTAQFPINIALQSAYLVSKSKCDSKTIICASKLVSDPQQLKYFFFTKLEDLTTEPSVAVLSNPSNQLPFKQHSGLFIKSDSYSKPYKEKGLLGHVFSFQNEDPRLQQDSINAFTSYFKGSNKDDSDVPKAIYPIMPNSITTRKPELSDPLNKPETPVLLLPEPNHHNHRGSYYKGGKCKRPIKQAHSAMDCDFTAQGAVCIAHCHDGYNFADNSKSKTSVCWNVAGVWNPSKYFPPCLPNCGDKCLNGGRCKSPGVCICDAEYRGDRCEYHVLKCNIHELAGANDRKITWVCKHNRNETICSVKCLPGSNFLEGPQPREYRCSIDGKWTPNEMPTCVSDILKCDQRNLAGRDFRKFDWVCQDLGSDTVCTVKCPPGSQLSGGQQSREYRCNMNGTWTPNFMSACIPY